MKFFFYFLGVVFLSFCLSKPLLGQKKVAFTIDDVPNTKSFLLEGKSSGLLKVLDSLQLPMAIFINESYIFKNDAILENFQLLSEWVKREYIQLGNHSYSHQAYSKLGLENYRAEIWKGEALTRALAKKESKPLKYFRFPFNDLGKDSVQHGQIQEFLDQLGYTLAPFTIESSDYIFNALYENYLSTGQEDLAQETLAAYVEHSLILFDYFDGLSNSLFQRSIAQIFLFHDSPLNTQALPLLVQELSKRNYEFISLEKALEDPQYQEKDYYFGKWGFTWFYRWIESEERRQKYLRAEPESSLLPFYRKYQDLMKDQ